jgi:glycosyltransferase involved in cell wall biosynthesis
MRIAVLHSFYSSDVPSGENVVVQAQVSSLQQAGHDVVLVGAYTDELSKKLVYPASAAIWVATGRGQDPTATLTRVNPDITHLHNLFPNFATRWLADWGRPVVATLHQFRPLCAAGTLYRSGQVCTLCPDGAPISAVRFGCYRHSRLATLPIAWRNRSGIRGDSVLSAADVAVVLSARAWSTYAHYGLPESRMALLPNFVNVDIEPGSGERNGAWLVVARLSEEKGVLNLVRAWPHHERLDIVGTGPQAEDIRRACPPNVRLLGQMPNGQVRSMISRCAGLIIPSRWFEGMPTVYLEALAAGTPVIAFRGNSAADDVETSERKIGVVVPREPTANELLAGLLEVRGSRKMSADCRLHFEDRFTERVWLRGIEEVYQRALQLHS